MNCFDICNNKISAGLSIFLIPKQTHYWWENYLSVNELGTEVDWNEIFSGDLKGEWYICTRLVRKLHRKLQGKTRIGRKPGFCHDYDNFVIWDVMNCISSGKKMPWLSALKLIWRKLLWKNCFNQRNVDDKTERKFIRFIKEKDSMFNSVH